MMLEAHQGLQATNVAFDTLYIASSVLETLRRACEKDVSGTAEQRRNLGVPFFCIAGQLQSPFLMS